MTENYSSDKLLGDIASVGVNAVNNVAHYLLNGCVLAHAGVNLQGFGNLRDEAGTDYASASGPVLRKRTAHAGSAITQRGRRPKEERQSEEEKEGDSRVDPRRNKRVKVAK